MSAVNGLGNRESCAGRVTPARRADLIERDRERNLAFRGHQRAEADVAPVSDLGEDCAGGRGDVDPLTSSSGNPSRAARRSRAADSLPFRRHRARSE